ncbi:hypothetical protein BMF94_5915 [Rhodotorula taiwanensis]|uniref:Mitochondrial intermembrane space import and assembly protein 40 n=1 Tax=Rhodotorula taiwanensis TaxID=741276 RepID=A0A2S5B2S5_9BASI|nr:hypothetical protein BMF94_5915 [Rhodotorula taiwanensis]
MLRTAVRPVARSASSVPRLAVRNASTGSTQRQYTVYQNQKTRPVVYASLGLAALFGWTAAILMVGGSGQKKSHSATQAVKDAVTSAADATATAVSDLADKVESKGKEVASTVADAADSAKEAVTDTAAAPSSQAAAFNPETGEINWDCPCLGGMADGPCGEEFKAAFSCFVFSEAEPKGIDCVDRFRNMQTCFRKHPDIYGDDADDDDEEDYDLIQRAEAALALPDEHFLEVAAEHAPTNDVANAAASLE